MRTAKPAKFESVGVDLGITSFATLDTGEKIDAPKPLKKNIRRLRKCQRNLARKQKDSNRRAKARLRVAKLHARIKDTRTDFLHKLTTRLVSENQAIAVEDLNVSGMLKKRMRPSRPKKGVHQSLMGESQGAVWRTCFATLKAPSKTALVHHLRAPRTRTKLRKLSKAISDLGWYQFRTLLEAKSEKYCRDFCVINRWEPSSQICSNCGERGGKKHLAIREWECLSCGSILDRDINAAKNIKAAGGHLEAICSDLQSETARPANKTLLGQD